jgi:hypothetical protein
MSGVEVAGAVLALWPVVIESLEFWQSEMMVFQLGKRDETLHDCLVYSYIEQHVFEETIVRLLEKVSVAPISLNSLRASVSVDPISLNSLRTSDFWRVSNVDERLKEKLGSAYDAFVDMCWTLNREIRRLMEQVDKVMADSSGLL